MSAVRDHFEKVLAGDATVDDQAFGVKRRGGSTSSASGTWTKRHVAGAWRD